MDYLQLSIANLAFGVISFVDLLYFTRFIFSGPNILTIIAIQILTMISGYIGYCISFFFVYYHADQDNHQQEKTLEVKISYIIGYFFLSLVASTYLYHSWLRAKIILFYKSNVIFKILDWLVKLLIILIFAPVVFQGLRLGSKGMEFMDFYATLAQQICGIFIFIFDLFLLYIFTSYFVCQKTAQELDYQKYLVARRPV